MILAPNWDFIYFGKNANNEKNASNENNANNVRKCLIQLVLTSMSIFPFEGIQSCNILQHHSIYQININIYINIWYIKSICVLQVYLSSCRLAGKKGDLLRKVGIQFVALGHLPLIYPTIITFTFHI